METETIPALIHQPDCRAHEYRDNDMCDCEPHRGGTHRAPGSVGSFTIHAPDDYRPAHMRTA